MANRGCLINSSSLTSDPAELQRLRKQAGHVDGIVATSANRLLIPWFLCFRKSDLRPVSCEFEGLELPCTTVEQAVRNLEQSLPVFEAITGDPVLAQQYWTLACSFVRRLPLPYLTMGIIEVLYLAPEYTNEIAGALSGDFTAIPHLKILSEYNDKALPYPIDVLFSIPNGKFDEARIWNATVLDGGFQPDFKFITWNRTTDTAEPATPLPPPDSVFGELGGVPDMLKQWIKAEVPISPVATAGLGMHREGIAENLQVNIYAGNFDDIKILENSKNLRSQLDEIARIRLQPWCRKYGFGWEGIRFAVPDWTQRTEGFYARLKSGSQ